MLNKYLSQCVCLELFSLPLTAHHVFHICIFFYGPCLKDLSRIPYYYLSSVLEGNDSRV